MSDQNFTPGPWKLEFREKWPFGFVISAGDYMLLEQSAYCHSSDQKTRQDNLDGVGFYYKRKTPNSTTRDEAITAIARQNADARLISVAPEMYQALYEVAELLDGIINRYRIAGEMDKVDAIYPTVHKIDDLISRVSK